MRHLQAAGRDVRHAVRSLAKARGFTFVCVVSLGLGMGTVMAILMMVRAIVGTPPFVNADGLVELLVRTQGPLLARTGGEIDSWTYPDFVDLAGADTGMSLTAWTFADTVLRVSEADEPQRLASMYVSKNYFSTIGVPLARGTGFESGGAGAPMVVVDHDLWQSRLGARPDVVGSTITLNRVPHVVVGVTPPLFRGHIGPEDSPDVRLWVPIEQHPRLSASNDFRFNREFEWLKIHGRLLPGTNLERARASASAVMASVAAQHPATNQHKAAVGVEPYHPMGARSRREVRTMQAILFGLSGMVLFIVCLNVSGMMAVRTAIRERELSVRLALGAGRARLMLYILAEALVLAVIGGAVAVFILFGIPAALIWYFEFWDRDLDPFRPDVWTFLICAALCFVTTLVFGLMPAIRFSRPNLVTALKDDAGVGGRRVGRLHKWTAAIQAGVAVPFLVFGGVKLDQVRAAAMADVGFHPFGLFAARVDLTGGGTNDVSRHAPLLLDRLRTSLLQAPSVTSVTVADGMPLDFRRRDTTLSLEGNAVRTRAHTTRVDEHYFDTLGIRIARGRGITAEDRAGAAPVVVISEPLAAQLFQVEDPAGKRVRFTLESLPAAGVGPNRQAFRSSDPAGESFTVVGVAADTVTSQMGTERPQIFVPLAQHPVSSVMLIARGTAADAQMMTAYKAAVSPVSPDFAPSGMTTGARLVRRSVRDLATHSALSVICAFVTLTLAVYGVVGFMVATRTREIGVRMALGATRLRVLRTVLVDAVKVVAPGVVLGLLGGVALVRVANAPETWYDLGAAEPLTYTAAAAIALGVAIGAALPSARRAIRINPIQAMRAE